MKKLITAMATMALAMAFWSALPSRISQRSPARSHRLRIRRTRSNPLRISKEHSPQPSSPDQDSSNSMQANQPSSFSGTVVKAGGKYVLKTSDMSCQLDDQQKAKKYVGQQVKVSGSLDSNTSTIHVSDISPMS